MPAPKMAILRMKSLQGREVTDRKAETLLAHPHLSLYLRAYPQLGRRLPLRWSRSSRPSLQSVLGYGPWCLRVSWGVAPSAAALHRALPYRLGERGGVYRRSALASSFSPSPTC